MLGEELSTKKPGHRHEDTVILKKLECGYGRDMTKKYFFSYIFICNLYEYFIRKEIKTKRN